jgi:dihydroorotate dehydrogenase
MSLIHDAAALALRKLDPETAHDLTVRALKTGLGPRDRGPDDPVLALSMAGLDLPNCVGLAAGFDKNAETPDAMLAAGFGFVECGTVTPLAQGGNPRPRLFRLTADRAVINRMGFNNQGLEAFAARLDRRPRVGVVGANLGANKDSADRIGDYVTGLKRLWGACDYFTVNVSSPNTPGLRDLQSKAALIELAGRLAEARADLRTGGTDFPLFLKVAPDLAEADVPGIAETARTYDFNGIIVSNTTIARPETLGSPDRAQAGGLSGAPLMTPSTHMLRLFHRVDRDLALVGVGGIASGADAYAKIRAGACAVQLYTALVFEGPGLVRAIKRDLALLLRADGFASVGEARGTD